MTADFLLEILMAAKVTLETEDTVISKKFNHRGIIDMANLSYALVSAIHAYDAASPESHGSLKQRVIEQLTEKQSHP